jgi:methionyl-tRNA formyltransferase
MTRRSPSIVFVGAHQEAVTPFRFLLTSGETVLGLVTLGPKRLRRLSGGTDLTAIPEAAQVPVLRVKNVNEPDSVQWIREKAPDLLLVVGWTQLVRDELLSVPRVACLGFHASLLPKYRGRAPVNWALINGETETGNTMIVLAPGADEGDIVAQRRIPITDEDDCATLYEKVSATEADMLAEVLPLIRRGELPRRRQDDSAATVMPRRRPEDGAIDWSLSTRRVFDWIRALTHPYPGAFTADGAGRIWVWKAERVDRPSSSSGSGTVELDEEGWPLVATADGWIRLLRVQREGEPEMSGREAAAFLEPGVALGQGTRGS